MFRLYAGLAAVALVITSIGGTAYASESALPGDALYSVKTKISEPIQTALIPSTKGKAAWHAILAERRLEEASLLAAKEELTPAVQSELAINFDEQVHASVASADRLQHSGDAVGSLDARSDLEARLIAHEQILNMMSAHLALASTSGAMNTKASLKSLLAIVEGHKASVEGSRLALEHALVPASPNAKVAADTVSTSTQGNPPRTLALSGEANVRATLSGGTPSASIANADAARTEEVQTILTRHAALFAKFMPTAVMMASTTATSTSATSTAATSTIEAKVEGSK